ncbi:MAG TPA: FkbM family methyltransferase [Candidatus Deferrimicrobium sp.]|nr:FkbM family methyltransferase [Candidatus Deferrimicrobium sp.]
MSEKLYQRAKELKVDLRHVVEVGVYYPETSNVLGFIKEGIRVDLFEPDPDCVERIKEFFKDYTNVKVLPFAIFKENGKVRLYRCGASTFAAELTVSPALVNDRYQPTAEDAFYAEARVFSDFDDGTIDLLSVDTEGCEWYVLMHLKSRPLVISLETGWKKYRNPYLSEIEGWMRQNGYEKWFRDGSDTVYISGDKFRWSGTGAKTGEDGRHR